ncbi:MAG: PilN domain-containing protein [Magnetococcales bacterium]|nr:PilN domain-containing protein [Magnetococcales bacterium]
MIRINLLPYRPAQRQRKLNTILTAWGVSALLSLLLLFGVDLFVLDTIQTLTNSKNNNSKTIQDLNEKLGEIKDINDRKALALTRLEIINRLSHEQSITIHVLDELTRAIPEQVWLTRMETQINQLMLNGLATSSAVVADFMRQLAASPYFSNVELSKIVQQEVQHGEKIQSFTMELKFAMPKPVTAASSPASEGAPVAGAQAPDRSTTGK